VDFCPDCLRDLTSGILYYITLETIYSGLSKSNFKNHHGDAAKCGYVCVISRADVDSAASGMNARRSKSGYVQKLIKSVNLVWYLISTQLSGLIENLSML